MYLLSHSLTQNSAMSLLKQIKEGYRKTVVEITDNCNDLQYVLVRLFVVLADPDVEERGEGELVRPFQRALEVPGRLVEVRSGRPQRRGGAGEQVGDEVDEWRAGETIHRSVDVHARPVVRRGLAFCRRRAARILTPRRLCPPYV